MKKIFATMMLLSVVLICQAQVSDNNSQTDVISILKDMQAKLSSLESRISVLEEMVNSDNGADGHEYVDLALPSKTLWATMNIGATTPEGYGNYYSWGETDATKSSSINTYDWSTYLYSQGSYSTLIKYCISRNYGAIDNKEELDPDDDAATVAWGQNWCTPTKAQQDELRTHCSWQWDTQKKGYVVTSNINSKSIFLPAAGYYNGSGISSRGAVGNYWARSLFITVCNTAFFLYFDSGSCDWNHGDRCYGRTIRAVRVKK